MIGTVPPAAAWPPESTNAPVDSFLKRLLPDVDLEPERLKELSRYRDMLRERLAEVVSWHAGDVDTVTTGSLAHGTWTSATSDADIAVRIHIAPEGWTHDAARAANDVRRWLSTHLDAEVTIHQRGFRIRVDQQPDIHADLCWRGPDGAWMIAQCKTYGRTSYYGDPTAHRDLLAARDAALGREHRLLDLIRLVKHLNATSTTSDPTSALSSFHLETLALSIFTAPFNLGEGVARFFAEAAELCVVPLAHPALPNVQLFATDPDAASHRFRYIAAVFDHALTLSSDQAERHLATLFGAVRQGP